MSSDEDDASLIGHSLRKRSKKLELPRKRRKSAVIIPEEDEINIEELYLQSNSISNFRPSSLETIYESPKGKNSCKTFMGIVKLKRRCIFSPFYEPAACKVRQRKKRAKTVKRVGLKSTHTVVSLEQVKKVIEELSDNENEENKITISNKIVSECKKDWCYKNNIIFPDESFTEINVLSSNLEDMNMETHVEMSKSISTLPVSSNDITGPIEKVELMNFDNFNSPQLTNKEKLKKHRRRSGRVQVNSFNLEEFDELITTGSPKSVKTLNPTDQSSIFKIQSSESITSIPKSNVSNCEIPDKEHTSIDANIHKSIDANIHKRIDAVIHKRIDADIHKRIDADIHKRIDADIHKRIDANIHKRRLLVHPNENALPQAKQPKKVKEKRTKARRVSGVNRPLYSSILNVSVEKPSINDSISLPISPGTLSPCSLFKDMQLNSPSSCSNNQNEIKTTRRRSTRLSQKHSYVSMCTSSTPSPKIRKKGQPKSIFPVRPVSSVSSVHSSKDIKTEETSLFNFGNNSPVISGMFDNKGMILNGKKIRIKSDDQPALNFKLFNANS